jgi:hypothetical protein
MKIAVMSLMILLLPAGVSADYTVFLTNGSRISGVTSIQDKGDMVTVYLQEGLMNIQKSEVLTIEEQEMPAEEENRESGTELPGEKTIQGREEQTEKEAVQEVRTSDDNTGKISALRAEFDSVTAEIRALESKEAKLVSLINDKSGSKQVYNQYQLRQLENELMPYRQDLQDIQHKKIELLDKRNSLADQIRELQ